LVIESIKGPGDLAWLTHSQLEGLAEEIRKFLIEKVSKTGGHLGPNLGVVELTIAVHRTFESPKDVVLFDTGHQSYVHKILTGRAAGFDHLRQRGGLVRRRPFRGEMGFPAVFRSRVRMIAT
jgi:1-deoxy-D-xylulose-5-phosphate synthase